MKQRILQVNHKSSKLYILTLFPLPLHHKINGTKVDDCSPFISNKLFIYLIFEWMTDEEIVSDVHVSVYLFINILSNPQTHARTLFCMARSAVGNGTFLCIIWIFLWKFLVTQYFYSKKTTIYIVTEEFRNFLIFIDSLWSRSLFSCAWPYIYIFWAKYFNTLIKWHSNYVNITVPFKAETKEDEKPENEVARQHFARREKK